MFSILNVSKIFTYRHRDTDTEKENEIEGHKKGNKSKLCVEIYAKAITIISTNVNTPINKYLCK
jgi:hypothetical protein